MRRLWYALLWLLVWATPAQAQFALVSGQFDQDNGGLWNTDGVHDAVGLTSACTPGNIVVIGTAMQPSTNTITSIDDASTTTYALLGRTADATRNNALEFWWGICAGSGGGQTLTVTANAATSHAQSMFVIWEFSETGDGPDTDQSGGQVNGAGGTTVTSVTTSSLTPTTTNTLYTCISLGTSTTTAYVVDGDFTSSFADTRRTIAYRLETAGAAHACTVTAGGGGPDSEDLTVLLGAFEEASGGAPASRAPHLLLLGVGGR